MCYNHIDLFLEQRPCVLNTPVLVAGSLPHLFDPVQSERIGAPHSKFRKRCNYFLRLFIYGSFKKKLLSSIIQCGE